MFKLYTFNFEDENMKKILGLFIVLCTISTGANAVTSGPIDLGNIQIITDGTPRVYLGNSIDGGALGCANNIPVILLDEPHGVVLYETLLSAKKSGQKVNLIASSCWSVFSTPVITSIYTY